MPRAVAQRKNGYFGIISASCILTASLPPVAPVSAAGATAQPQASGNIALSYADLADLAFTGQLVAGITVAKAKRLKGELAPGLAPGMARFLIEANTEVLLRGADGMPGEVEYIVDVPLDAKGKAPKLKKRRFIVIADRVPGRPYEIRLTSPYSQIDWTPFNESTLRSILTEASSPAAAPAITGVGSGFYVPGAIPGESESQIFLTTANNRPISLSILRRPGERPRWTVALTEIIDESAKAPQRNTLLWYRLACFLPPQLPPSSIASMPAREGHALSRDYRLVIEQLGPCGRSIPR